jgi:sulfonate transport system substrate-binding protein
MNTRPHTARRRRGGHAAVATILVSVLAVAGCGGSATGNEGAVDDDGSVDLSEVTLIVGDQKGGSKALLTAAGELDDVDYKITWKTFTSGPPLLEALNAGAIHVGGVGNTPPLFAAAAKSKFKAVQAATYGGIGDAIVVPADSPITSVADLEGKTVGVAEGSSANYNLLAQLENAGLSYSDVKVKNLQPADALAAFSNGHLDAWAIWEPYTSQAEKDAGAKVIADGRDLANGYVFQVASDAALEEPATQAALQDYLARISRAQVWSRDHQEEWAKVWSQETGLSEDVTLPAVQKRKIELVPIDQAVIDSEQAMADTFAENGLVPRQFDVAPYFIDDYNAYTTGEQ